MQKFLDFFHHHIETNYNVLYFISYYNVCSQLQIVPQVTSFTPSFSDECYCDNSYGLWPKVPDGGCSLHCSDDKNMTCGGRNTISIYQVQGTVARLSRFGYVEEDERSIEKNTNKIFKW